MQIMERSTASAGLTGPAQRKESSVQPQTFDPYPVDLTVDYEDGQRDRLTVGFRIFTAIPILVVLALLSSGQVSHGYGWRLGGSGVLLLPTLLMLLFGHKYPGWWFDFNFKLVRLSNRSVAYL